MEGAKNGERTERAERKEFTPVKRYSFPAGNCGGTINVTIPAFATKEEVETAAAMLSIVAERWKITE